MRHCAYCGAEIGEGRDSNREPESCGASECNREINAMYRQMDEEAQEAALQILMRKCRHFTGVQTKTCKAGVNYDDVSPIPCIGLDSGEVKQAICDKKSCWSREEAIKIEKERDEKTKDFFLALKTAHEDAKTKGYKKGHGGKDSVPCPVCGSGTLHYSVASCNGHLWGQCDTKGCVAWMQ